jgi:hypothetical protein
MLFQYIGKAETRIYLFRFKQGTAGFVLAGIKTYIIQGDGNIGKVLENRNIAAPHYQPARQLFVQLFNSQFHQALLLVIQNSDCRNRQDQDGDGGQDQEPDQYFSYLRFQRMEF